MQGTVRPGGRVLKKPFYIPNKFSKKPRRKTKPPLRGKPNGWQECTLPNATG